MGSCQSSNYIKVPHEKRFRRAIKLHEVAEVEILMNIVNRNRCFETGESPLTLAAQEGHEAVVETLIKGGADVNKLDRNGRGPLHISVQMNDLETVDILLNGGADPNKYDINNVTPLQIASERGYPVMVEKLLEVGANPNSSFDGCSPLILAAARGHGNCVAVLLKHGADPNVVDASGDSPLRLAVSNGDSFSTMKLLEQGSLRSVDRDADLGALAAFAGEAEVLEALFSKGYDINGTPDVNNTPPPLVIATAMEAVDCVGVLLRSGSNPNIKDRIGQSPLHIATMSVADLQKKSYFLRYFSNVYRQYSKYDLQDINFENCIKCVTNLIQCGADVSFVWNKFIQVFPSGDTVSFEQMVLCEVLIQAYGFVDLPNRKLRYFVKNLLNIHETGLVRLLYSAGVEPDWADQSVLAMSFVESERTMFRFIKWMCSNPRKLKDLCRQKLRRHLSWNVLYLANRLPLANNLIDYICIIDTDCYSAADAPS